LFLALPILVLGFVVQCVPPKEKMTESPIGPDQNLSSQGIQPYRQAAAKRGYVRVGPTQRYFQFEDGTPFIPIGHNEWPHRLEASKHSLESIDSYFRIMSQNGENVLRLVLGSPKLPIEKPPGTFNPAFKEYMDLVVQTAEKHNIYLDVVMWPNVFNVPKFLGFGLSWSENLYNKKNGGPVAKFEDLFRNPEAMRLQEGRIRFFVDNWGKSRSIFAWEIANEFNYDNNRWINHMAAYCRKYERSKWGKTHLVGISVSTFTFGTRQSAQWTSPELDFASFHTYELSRIRKIKGRGTTKIENLTFATPEFFHEVQEKCTARPIFDSEIPGIPHGKKIKLSKWPKELSLMEEWFLGTGWAYMCSGAAGPGFRWASTPLFNIGGAPNALSVKMYQYQLATRRITDRVDWNVFDPVPYTGLSVQGPDGQDLRVLSLISRDRKRVLAWVFERYGATAPIRAKVSFSSLGSGPHLVSWYDDRTGRELASGKNNGASFTVTSPSFLGHTVLIVKPAGS